MSAQQAEATVQSAAEEGLKLWGNISLADPWFLALLPLLLLYFLLRARSGGGVAGRVPALPTQRVLSLRQRVSWLPSVLNCSAVVLVVVALARPLEGDVETSTETEGVDIALVLDRSSSMEADDLEPGRTRLDVVKEVVADFAERRMTDEEGASDNVALFSFARFPSQLCPFTLDVDAIRGFLGEVELVRHREEDGTGIGIALAKAVAVLRESEAESKVVVLLTDGEDNLPMITPSEAGEMAAEEGIRVYTVFAGRYVFDPFGRRISSEQLKNSDLKRIADLTDGRFFRARDREGLEAAYAEIEALEKTPLEEQRFVEHYDLYFNFLIWAFIAWILGWASEFTWARRLP
ncbi:MAG: VWA domain-containing protein [Planctomycetes bacterium]|nr:VWA domain-containing protein [Planctomycetota bacterium]